MSEKMEAVATSEAPAALGAYSQPKAGPRST